MSPEQFLEQFGYLTDAPGGIAKLRVLILQLAVRGKLVEQDPNDEAVSVLLEKIKDEKERLIKDGKIKMSKPLPPVNLDEVPFKLPDGWEAIRLVDATGFNIGKTPPTKESRYWDDTGTPWVTIKDLTDKGRVSSTAKTITQEACSKVFKQPPCSPGTILVSFKLTIGKISILEVDAYHNEAIASLIPFSIELQQFLFVFLPQLMQTGQLKNAIKGKTLNSTSLKQLVIPLPPVNEQVRIVTKVNQFMALCDELEAKQNHRTETHRQLIRAAHHHLTKAHESANLQPAWHRIRNHFDHLYTTPEAVKELRQTILQLAVQGKLVPQDPNDEPASVLLEKIKAEKERLIKEKKIKKGKPLPPINLNEVPFALPDGWAWARFPEVGEFGRGKSKHRPRNDPSLYSGGKYPMVQTGDIARANSTVKTYTALYNNKGLAQSRLWPKGTMCITIAANIADSSILEFDACFPDSVVGLVPSVEIGDSRYFEYFVRTAKEHLMDFAPSTAQKNINLGILVTVYIPLPPLAEMKRIVTKVNQFMALCDELEAKITTNQTTAEHYAMAITQQIAAA